MRWHPPAQPSSDCCLSRRVLTCACGKHLPDDHRIYCSGINGCLLQGTSNRDCSQLWRGKRSKLAFKTPLWRARSGDNDDVSHEFSFKSLAIMSVGSVASMTSWTDTPGAVSTSTSPCGVTS